MQVHEEAMVKSLVAVAWADGKVHEQETEVIDALIAAFELEGEDADAIREYAKKPRKIDDVALTYLAPADRRLLLQHAVIVTWVDGEQTEDERRVLEGLVARLEIPWEEAQALMRAAEERAKRLQEMLG
ncbi:MAG TPA: DUF533 domain-containing protein [Polyangiaceae bacterium LLY-WYZ-14_1]|jgi:uncharacterized tellurite resistance protein B-like protein|nr:DUF533 domain-containing protein [Polyangiaceae bacterium LLY-WYZ-14_1]